MREGTWCRPITSIRRCLHVQVLNQTIWNATETDWPSVFAVLPAEGSRGHGDPILEGASYQPNLKPVEILFTPSCQVARHRGHGGRHRRPRFDMTKPLQLMSLGDFRERSTCYPTKYLFPNY
ncbi:hypothetical protein T265_14070, partial [Opisthorchis viverrini]